MSNYKQDPLEIIVMKFVLVFITTIIAIYLLSPIVSIFGMMPSTNDTLMDTFMFKVIPIVIAFVIMYRIFKIFSS